MKERKAIFDRMHGPLQSTDTPLLRSSFALSKQAIIMSASLLTSMLTWGMNQHRPSKCAGKWFSYFHRNGPDFTRAVSLCQVRENVNTCSVATISYNKSSLFFCTETIPSSLHLLVRVCFQVFHNSIINSMSVYFFYVHDVSLLFYVHDVTNDSFECCLKSSTLLSATKLSTSVNQGSLS